jgi:hypothetical protein
MAETPKLQMCVPEWLMAPLQNFIDHQKRLADFYQFSRSGFEMAIFSASRVKELREQLARATADCEAKNKELGIDITYPLDEDDDNYTATQNRAEKAKREVDAGYPILHELHTVILWSSLEWFVEEFLISWMEYEPSAMQLDEIRKIKISISDYESVQGMEKYYYILQELQHTLKTPFKRGAEQFESVLNIFGLSGEIGDIVKTGLIELESVRNVLLHRKGIIDARFCRACPWLKAKIGTRIVVGETEWYRYIAAAFDYVKGVLERGKSRHWTIARASSEV